MYYQVKSLDPGLHIVSIPIGRARDITLNALDVLSSADVIVAEDTRVIKKLLNIYEISVSKVRLLAYHDHNAKKQVPKIMNLLKEGRSIALVSDAGTPLISDPGYLLVNEATNIDVLVTASPGPSALLAALTVSGLPTDRFTFCGFLPNQKLPRLKYFNKCDLHSTTLIFFETSSRILATLEDLIPILGKERKIVVCRELTKKFETIYRGTALQVKESLQSDILKGELVLLISPGIEEVVGMNEIDMSLKKLMKSHSLKESVKIVSENLGVNKNIVYKSALKINGN